MSNAGVSLLRGICESPGDNSLRLVYADWLEDTGQADHAGVIRAQVQGQQLTSQQKIWMHQHVCSLAANLGVGPGAIWSLVKWKFGFVGEIELPLAVYSRWGAYLFSSYPITRVILNDRYPYAIYEGCVYWCYPVVTGQAPPYHCRLPRTIFNELPGERHCLSYMEFKMYTSTELAVQNLSCVLVARGRRRARLPAL